MRIQEGRGYLLRSGLDTPFAAWICASQLDHHVPIQAAPWMLVRMAGELAGMFPGGCALLWDLPLPILSALPHEARAAFWSALGHLPGLSLHLRDEAFAAQLDEPIPGWFHSANPPEGALGQAWRQGWIGWVPEEGSAWILPELGRTEEARDGSDTPAPGFLWGELILPLGALSDVRAEDVASRMADAQARSERDLSLRMSAQAWPSFIPFQRRRTAWRVAVLGGCEYRQAGGRWEEAAQRLDSFSKELATILRTPVFPGVSNDVVAANLLGHQAMREGLPWRHSLPIPPLAPSFTPGLGADPREPAPIESRADYPRALADVLSHPPIALLRTPRIPSEASVAAFLRGLTSTPAIHWLPSEVPPPGPHMQERPWHPANAFAPLMDVSQVLQPRLFDDLE